MQISGDLIALWGAITGTVALLWNVCRDLLIWYKNRAGFEFESFFGDSKSKNSESTKCLFIQIQNVGGKPTSAYNFTIRTWPTKWHCWLGLCAPIQQSLKVQDVSLDGQNAWPTSSIKMTEASVLGIGTYRLFICEFPTLTPYRCFSKVYIAHTLKKPLLAAVALDRYHPISE